MFESKFLRLLTLEIESLECAIATIGARIAKTLLSNNGADSDEIELNYHVSWMRSKRRKSDPMKLQANGTCYDLKKVIPRNFWHAKSNSASLIRFTYRRPLLFRNAN